MIKRYVFNEDTNMMIEVGGDKYKQLIKSGMIFDKIFDTKKGLFSCGIKGCIKRVLFYNIDEEFIIRWCTDHKTATMISINACDYKNCKIQASYKKPGEKLTRCTTHKTDEMIPNKKCIIENCKNTATFGIGKDIHYCKTHSNDTMKCIQSICKYNGCDKSPSYGLINTKPEYCVSHKLPNMIPIPKHKCYNKLCHKNATYKYVGEKPTSCNLHKLEGMVVKCNKSCKEEFCDIWPSYSYPNQPAEYCVCHKKPGMINKANKICIDENCEQISHYGYKDGEIIYCKKHKLLDMINLDNKICVFNDCYKYALYGVLGKSAQLCKTHADNDHVNVKIKHCGDKNCNKKAYYNIPGQSAIKCSTHKTDEMISHPTKKCIVCKIEPALYGIYNVQERCEMHKIEGDINHIEKKCISCDMSYILDQDKKCFYCSDSTQLKFKLKKQNEVVSFLLRNDLIPNKIDKQLEDGTMCQLRSRPDIIYDCLTHFIIVEVDEDQHKSNNKQCEINRMININQVLGIKTIFIRYNPDGFKSMEKEPNQIKRFKILKEELEYYMINPPEELLTAKYLFYDHYKYTEEQLRVIEM